MIGTIFFAIVFVCAVYLHDYIQEIFEEFLEWSSEFLTEHLSEILIFIPPTALVLLLTYIFYNRRLKNEMKRLNCTPRITLEEYNKNKEIWTAEAVAELKESPEYREYLKNKKNGTLKEIELTEDDKIVLSDESDEENEEINNIVTSKN